MSEVELVVVAVPARNEAGRIGPCLASIDVAAREWGGAVTMLVGADACTDATATVVGTLRAGGMPVRVVEGSWRRPGRVRARPRRCRLRRARRRPRRTGVDRQHRCRLHRAPGTGSSTRCAWRTPGPTSCSARSRWIRPTPRRAWPACSTSATPICAPAGEPRPRRQPRHPSQRLRRRRRLAVVHGDRRRAPPRAARRRPRGRDPVARRPDGDDQRPYLGPRQRRLRQRVATPGRAQRGGGMTVVRDGYGAGMDEPATGTTTLTSVLDAYTAAGFAGSFSVVEGARLQCHSCNETFDAASASMSSLRRMEGASDPDDMLAVVAITCPACSQQGHGGARLRSERNTGGRRRAAGAARRPARRPAARQLRARRSTRGPLMAQVST